MPIQLLIYLFIGGTSALINLLIFLGLYNQGFELVISTTTAFILAAIFNYVLSTTLLFRRNARWGTFSEILIYALVVISIAGIDYLVTRSFISMDLSGATSKILATLIAFILNFLGRKYFVFPEKEVGDWKKQHETTVDKKDEEPVERI